MNKTVTQNVFQNVYKTYVIKNNNKNFLHFKTGNKRKETCFIASFKDKKLAKLICDHINLKSLDETFSIPSFTIDFIQNVYEQASEGTVLTSETSFCTLEEVCLEQLIDKVKTSSVNIAEINVENNFIWWQSIYIKGRKEDEMTDYKSFLEKLYIE